MIGIVLAGGLATRMGGGDKGLVLVGGVPILERVIATMRPQCDALVINANGDAGRFARYGLPVVPDDPAVPAGTLGPLAGVLAGLDWVAAHHPEAVRAVTVPTDTPFLPADLVARLAAALEAHRAPLACASSGGRVHGVVALWSVALRHDLRRALDEGLRKVGLFAERQGYARAVWPVEPCDPFLNANTPEDRVAAERIAEAMDRKTAR